MPWPKGKPFTKEHKAKRAATMQQNKKRHKKPVSVNGVECFVCCTCKLPKPAAEYHKDKRTPNGLKAQCKECHGRTSVSTRDREKANASKRAAEATRRARKANVRGIVRKADYDQLRVLLGDSCLKCGSAKSVQWDHIVPLALGGMHSVENLQPLCRKCNERKQASTADYRTEEQRAAIENWVVSFKVLSTTGRPTLETSTLIEKA
ncbi:HNH endonuclease signature motif containing protein [Flaviaesturariibacter amylovorans]|uniref:HNH nuclease domain-containing protein n=1 Tax=Flaviaesturariibacter amylovorans TaxID=1084520 RepID=A0ABP8GQI0_9BACT